MAEAVAYSTDTSDMLIPHNMFRSFFATAPAIIESVDGSDAEHGAAVFSYLDNVLRFLDAHHGGEDAILWPVLTERCPESRTLIERMEQEHATVHARREAVQQALDSWQRSESSESRERVRSAMRALESPLEQHFAEEESELLPVASRHMSPEEWGQLPGHALQHFTGDKPWLVFGLIFEPMSADELEMTYTLLPPPVVADWKSRGQAAFDEFIALVRRGA